MALDLPQSPWVRPFLAGLLARPARSEHAQPVRAPLLAVLFAVGASAAPRLDVGVVLEGSPVGTVVDAEPWVMLWGEAGVNAGALFRPSATRFGWGPSCGFRWRRPGSKVSDHATRSPRHRTPTASAPSKLRKPSGPEALSDSRQPGRATQPAPQGHLRGEDDKELPARRLEEQAPARRPPVTLGRALTVARLLRGLVHSAARPRDLAPLRPRQRGARGPLGVIVGESVLHSGAPREPALRALLPVMRVHGNKILPVTRDTGNGPSGPLPSACSRSAPMPRGASRPPQPVFRARAMFINARRSPDAQFDPGRWSPAR